MRKLLPVVLSAFLISPLTALLGASSALGEQDDDILAVFSSGNFPRALQVAKSAADKGDFMGQFIVARIYEEGYGVPKDKSEAKKWFQKTLDQVKPAAEKGDPRAQFVLGRMHDGGWLVPKDAAKTLAWYRKAAEQGYSWAQTNLGASYAAGEGVAKDEKEAVAWYRKAAQQGNPAAQVWLGYMYQAGMGVNKDEKEAGALYRKASEQGNAYAQVRLGQLYESGQGVDKDEKEAVALFRKAAEQGNADGQLRLGVMYLTGKGIGKDESEAAAWYRKAADQGNANAQDNLGVMYAFGLGVSKDEKEAADWYRKAAEQGYADAQNHLGLLYKSGLGVSQSDRKAVAWFRKAAEQGNADGQTGLGLMYMSGAGVYQDGEKAAAWFRKAAEQGDAQGQFYLGIMYKNGAGVPKDISQAVAWFRKSADQGNSSAKDKLRELGISTETQSNSTAANTVSKEDLRDMIQAALKTNTQAQTPAAPKTLVSDVDKPGYSTPENADDFAVVIGVEKYASLPAADFAERDAEAVRAHLQAMGYPARNIYFLSGQQATRAKIAQAVNTWLPGRVSPASTVFFYYSGHGAPDPKTNQAYLVPTDGDPEDLDSTAYPIKLLYEKLGKLKTKQVIVALDSCFSGAGGRSVLAKGTRPLVGKIDMGGLPDNMVALTASDKSQISGTIEDQGHGTFTYYMLKGLEGAAKDSAGHVTMQSLHAYLTPKVQNAARLQNRDQTPQLMNAKRGGTALR